MSKALEKRFGKKDYSKVTEAQEAFLQQSGLGPNVDTSRVVTLDTISEGLVEVTDKIWYMNRRHLVTPQAHRARYGGLDLHESFEDGDEGGLRTRIFKLVDGSLVRITYDSGRDGV